MCTPRHGDPADLPPLEYGTEVVDCKGIECQNRSCVPEELDDEGFCPDCSLHGLEDDDGHAPEADGGELGPIADPLT